jgi:hypothetical protein
VRQLQHVLRKAPCWSVQAECALKRLLQLFCGTHLLLAKVIVLGVEVDNLRLRSAHCLGTRTGDAIKRNITLATNVEDLHVQIWHIRVGPQGTFVSVYDDEGRMHDEETHTTCGHF